MTDWLAALIGLITGASMSVALSCVWVVLMIPARLQDRLRAGSPRLLGAAMGAGLLLSALHDVGSFSLALPDAAAWLLFVFSGMFVGMLSSALGEILEVTPVLVRRFRLGDASPQIRLALVIAKGIGALIACLTFPL